MVNVAFHKAKFIFNAEMYKYIYTLPSCINTFFFVFKLCQKKTNFKVLIR